MSKDRKATTLDSLREAVRESMNGADYIDEWLDIDGDQLTDNIWRSLPEDNQPMTIIDKANASRSYLYIQGFLSESENDRVRARIRREISREESTDAVRTEPRSPHQP